MKRFPLVLLVGLLAGAPVPASEPPRLAFNRALDDYAADRYAGALERLDPLARTGFPPAQMLLGLMYMHGEGVPRDETVALHWYRRAAKAGHVPAFYQLGLAHARGLGVERSLWATRHWLGRAAKAGHYEAEMLLRDLDDGVIGSSLLKGSGNTRPAPEG